MENGERDKVKKKKKQRKEANTANASRFQQSNNDNPNGRPVAPPFGGGGMLAVLADIKKAGPQGAVSSAPGARPVPAISPPRVPDSAAQTPQKQRRKVRKQQTQNPQVAPAVTMTKPTGNPATGSIENLPPVSDEEYDSYYDSYDSYDTDVENDKKNQKKQTANQAPKKKGLKDKLLGKITGKNTKTINEAKKKKDESDSYDSYYDYDTESELSEGGVFQPKVNAALVGKTSAVPAPAAQPARPKPAPVQELPQQPRIGMPSMMPPPANNSAAPPPPATQPRIGMPSMMPPPKVNPVAPAIQAPAQPRIGMPSMMPPHMANPTAIQTMAPPPRIGMPSMMPPPMTNQPQATNGMSSMMPPPPMAPAQAAPAMSAAGEKQRKKKKSKNRSGNSAIGGGPPPPPLKEIVAPSINTLEATLMSPNRRKDKHKKKKKEAGATETMTMSEVPMGAPPIPPKKPVLNFPASNEERIEFAGSATPSPYKTRRTNMEPPPAGGLIPMPNDNGGEKKRVKKKKRTRRASGMEATATTPYAQAAMGGRPNF